MLTVRVLLTFCVAIIQPVLSQEKCCHASYADIVEKTIDAVVTISAVHFYEENMENPRKGAKKNRKLAEKIKGSIGSGFIISSKKDVALIVTNHHVVQEFLDDKNNKKNNKKNVFVLTNKNEEYNAEIVGIDPNTDLVLLKIRTKKILPALTWGNSQTMRTGDPILAIGNPYGMSGTVTSGIISQKKRNFDNPMGEAFRVPEWIQVDAHINKGNSGGPLLNTKGEVIGVNTAIFSPKTEGGSVGIGFAIPSHQASYVVNELTMKGCVKRGVIGIKIGKTVNEEIGQHLGMEEKRGVLVDDVYDDSPAQKAGLKPGDVLLSVNKVAMHTAADLYNFMSLIKPDTFLNVTFWREHKVWKTSMVSAFENCPIAENTSQNYVPELGMELVPDKKKGARVTRIIHKNPYWKKINVHDVIVKIGDKDVKDVNDVKEYMQTIKQHNQKTVLVRLTRPSQGLLHVVLPLMGSENDF